MLRGIRGDGHRFDVAPFRQMRWRIQGDPGHRLQGGRGHEGGHRTHGRRWRAGRRRHIGVLALREGRLQVVVPAVRVPHRLAGGAVYSKMLTINQNENTF